MTNSPQSAYYQVYQRHPYVRQKEIDFLLAHFCPEDFDEYESRLKENLRYSTYELFVVGHETSAAGMKKVGAAATRKVGGVG